MASGDVYIARRDNYLQGFNAAKNLEDERQDVGL